MQFLHLHLRSLWVGLILVLSWFGLMESANTAVSNVRCIESERLALLNFKKSLRDTANLLASWTTEEEDCCRWNRVGCNNQTGHVVMLDLRPQLTDYGDGFGSATLLTGEISSSLLQLPYLSHLDLSGNGFDKFPAFIGQLSELKYLNLSFNYFGGTFPYQLGKLSKLQYLDLSWNDEMKADNFEWLDRLSSLKLLNISYVTFSEKVDWLKSVKKHSSLSDLVLHRCKFLETNPASISHVDSSKSLDSLRLWFSTFNNSNHSWLSNVSSAIISLDIQDDYMKGPIPDYFGRMKSLQHLKLSYNHLEGGLPASFNNLSQLKTLDLSNNNLSGTFLGILENLGCAKNTLEILRLGENRLTGSVPDITEFESLRELYLDNNHLDGSFPENFRYFSKLHILNFERNQLVGSLPNLSQFSSLTELRMSSNKLNGSISGSIGQIASLKILDASANKFSEVLLGSHLSNLSKLQQLDLSYNSLTLDFSLNWIPPFQLDTIKLSSCKLGLQFPTWLQSQRNFSYLDISSSSISDNMPSWFWNFPSKLRYLNLSFNHIYGKVPSNLQVQFFIFPAVDLSSNLFYGPIPQFLYNTTVLNLSKNRFTGSLSLICKVLDSALTYLDLSDNLLSGGLPDCWVKMKMLVILNLENNGFSGMIPRSMSSLNQIQTLRLRNNSFTGQLPNLKNCSMLELLDLGENELTGKVSAWIGERVTKLIVLSLRSNKFYGSIPSNICHVSSIQILDISFNNLSGSIPSCLNNFTAMAERGSLQNTISHDYMYSYVYWKTNGEWGSMYSAEYFDHASVTWRGIEQRYGKTLGLLKLIDLSNNNLSGEIPEPVTKLLGIISFNLSRNTLSGAIPERIGQLKALESLDLSHNQLSGEIPRTIVDIFFLGVLDLSDNKLTGRIPTGTQLQGFSASAYSRNAGLCGPPLPNECPGERTVKDSPASVEEGEEWLERSWLYAGAGVGFFVGFWGVLLIRISCMS